MIELMNFLIKELNIKILLIEEAYHLLILKLKTLETQNGQLDLFQITLKTEEWKLPVLLTVK